MLCKHFSVTPPMAVMFVHAGHINSLGTDNQTPFSWRGPQSLASCPTLHKGRQAQCSTSEVKQ